MRTAPTLPGSHAGPHQCCDSVPSPAFLARRQAAFLQENSLPPTKIRPSTCTLWAGVIISVAVWEFKPIISAWWERRRPALNNCKNSRNRDGTALWSWNLNVDRSGFTRRERNSTGWMLSWMLSEPTGSNGQAHCLTTPGYSTTALAVWVWLTDLPAWLRQDTVGWNLSPAPQFGHSPQMARS